MTQQIIARRDAFMSKNYPRYPIVMVRGEGCYLFDADGKRYLDLFAGFGAGLLGHCHPDLVAAVNEQATRLWHPGNLLHSEPQTLVAESIAKLGFNGRSFFCHSGADANEAALKLARLYGHAKPGPAGQRYRVISATKSFHGRSFGTMCATGEPKVREGFGPLAPGFVNVSYNDMSAIQEAIDDVTVAVLVEPIQGEGGVNVPDDDYLTKLRNLCDERDLLLICDEVWTGCGRTGRYFAHQHWEIEPDIMTLGKGVGGGMAVGVMCAQPKLAELNDAVKQVGVKHATTLGGNCLAMAVSAAVFRVLERDVLTERAASMGQRTMEALRAMAARMPAIKTVRGKGLFIGIDLDRPAKDVVDKCMERGVLFNAPQPTVLRMAPPLVVDQDQLDEGLEVFETVLRL